MENETTIGQRAACYWTNRPASELDYVAPWSWVVGVQIDESNEHRYAVRTGAGICAVDPTTWRELREHFVWYRQCVRFRTPDDAACARCALRSESSPLSFGSRYALCRGCELEIGLALGTSWPYCRKCACPFPTTSAGNPSRGFWVSGDGDVCDTCRLLEECHRDVDRIVWTVTGRGAGRLVAAVGWRKLNPEQRIVADVEISLWQSPVLFELLRLDRISLLDTAASIHRLALQIVAESPARSSALKDRRALWRDEQRDPKVKFVRGIESASFCAG